MKGGDNGSALGRTWIWSAKMADKERPIGKPPKKFYRRENPVSKRSEKKKRGKEGSESQVQSATVTFMDAITKNLSDGVIRTTK